MPGKEADDMRWRRRARATATALLLTFGDSSLDIQLRIFTSIVDRRPVENQVNTEITCRFEEEGIEIPFPQQDLHLRSVQDEEVLDAIHEAGERRKGT